MLVFLQALFGCFQNNSGIVPNNDYALPNNARLTDIFHTTKGGLVKYVTFAGGVENSMKKRYLKTVSFTRG